MSIIKVIAFFVAVVTGIVLVAQGTPFDLAFDQLLGILGIALAVEVAPLDLP